MRKFGGGLVSLTFGVAVELSQPEGLVYPVVAWTAFVVGGLLILASWLVRVRRRRDRAGKRRGVRRELRELGHSVLDFVGQREAEAPSGIRPIQSHVRHPIRTARERRVLREYEADTVSMYRDRFGSEVRRMLREIVGDRVGRLEGQMLLTPGNLEEISRVGWRLVELGGSRSRIRPLTPA